MSVCPLLLIAVKKSDGILNEPYLNASECLKEKCAWHVRHEAPDSQACAIKDLSDVLKLISMK